MTPNINNAQAAPRIPVVPGSFIVLASWLAISFALIKFGESNDLLFLLTLAALPLLSIACYLIYVVLQCSNGKPRHPGIAALWHLVIAGLLLVGSFHVASAAHWLLWDPIECPGAPLETDNVRTIPNHSGDIATVRRSACEIGLIAGTDAQYYFVFVHRLGQRNSANNLVLRYDTDEKGWNQPPLVEWVDEKTLRITTRSKIHVVSQQRSSVDGTQILYRLPQAWQYETNITAWERLWEPDI
jgi:hypothetical protein